jgi:hypothetical protein
MRTAPARRPLLIATVVVATAISLAGCTAAGSSQSSAGPVAGTVAGSAGSVAGSAGSAPGASAVEPDAAPGKVAAAGVEPATASTDRSVIVTGTVTVTATDPIAAADRAVTIVEGSGGRVDGRTENAAAHGDRGSATVVLRIPAAKLTTTLDALKKLGRADQVQLSSSDVTAQTQDLDARTTALRATIARLLQLEATATDTKNLIDIETAIGDRQGELESLEAQQRGLADQVAMSTITLDLRSDAAAPPIAPADFWSGLGTGWTAFLGFWASSLVVVGVLLPWLAFIALAVAIVLAVRVARRRARRSGVVTPPTA